MPQGDPFRGSQNVLVQFKIAASVHEEMVRTCVEMSLAASARRNRFAVARPKPPVRDLGPYVQVFESPCSLPGERRKPWRPRNEKVICLKNGKCPESPRKFAEVLLEQEFLIERIDVADTDDDGITTISVLWSRDKKIAFVSNLDDLFQYFADLVWGKSSGFFNETQKFVWFVFQDEKKRQSGVTHFNYRDTFGICTPKTTRKLPLMEVEAGAE